MRRTRSLAGFAPAALAAACSSTSAPGPQAQSGASPPPTEIQPGLLAGYLPKGAAPNSLTLIPAPPAPGSAAQALDDATAKAAVALNGGPRWTQAAQDAKLMFPATADTFSCALDVRIDQADTPRLYMLLRRTLTDVGLSTYPTKIKFQRARPFMVAGTPICTPKEEAFLRKDGSYPSGHSAAGWGWALVLTEVAPERADAILARGRAFGESRLVCNVHWRSDVEEGRVTAAATVARLHDQPDFRADLDAARAEVASARTKDLGPTRDCATEAARLAAG
jgi:acid phosphatase (class A)